MAPHQSLKKDEKYLPWLLDLLLRTRKTEVGVRIGCRRRKGNTKPTSKTRNMKRLTNYQLDRALEQLLERGEIVIGKIRVNDGENIASYTALRTCPPEHRDGYRRALETGRDTYLRDVVYEPVFMATEYATSVATLE